MARTATRTDSTTARPPTIDAIKLLKQDHREVEDLFEKFEDADADEQETIAQRVCQLLTVHAQIEEEILYPAAKEALADEEDQDLVNEAEVEHASAKDLIAKIEDMSSDDEAFKATVKVLSEYIKHHVKEEEKEMFPKLKEADLDLKALGAEMSQRKTELMEELGIETEEEPATPARKAKGRGRAKNTRTAKRRKH